MFDPNYFCLTSSGKFFEGDDWWMFLSVDPGIIDYYLWFAKRNGWDVLKGSARGPHISIVKGEEPSNYPAWNKIQGKKLVYKYSNNLRHNNKHCWLDVEVGPFNDFRASIGLRPFRSFHLTIGRFKPYV